MFLDKLKKSNGIITTDAIVAVLILTLFSGLIVTISYNIYISNASIKRMSKAIGYIEDVFEYVDKNYYDDVDTAAELKTYFNNKYYFENNGNTPKQNAEVYLKTGNEQDQDTPFKATITITKYNTIPGNQDKEDLVMEINMKVEYKLGNKNQKIEMKKNKVREKNTVPDELNR